MTELRYYDDDFPVRARKLITSGDAFSFEVVGEAYRLLQPYLGDCRITDIAKLGLKSKLRPLLGVLTLSGGLGRSVSLELGDTSLVVRVGG